MFYLAEVKARLGKKEEAFDLYKAAFKMPVITMDDGDAHDKVKNFALAVFGFFFFVFDIT